MTGFKAPAICAVLGMAMLAGCSSIWPSSAAPPVAPTRWVCDSQVEVLWHFTDKAQHKVDVQLGGTAQVYHLVPEPGSDGVLYSDGVLAFNIKDNQGLVYWVATNDLIGRACKAP